MLSDLALDSQLCYRLFQRDAVPCHLTQRNLCFEVSGIRVISWLYSDLTPFKQLGSFHGGRRHICVSWLSHTSTNTNFFPKPLTTFLTCVSRGEKRKYTGKKFCLNRVSNSQPPGHESDTLTTEPPGRGAEYGLRRLAVNMGDRYAIISFVFHKTQGSCVAQWKSVDSKSRGPAGFE